MSAYKDLQGDYDYIFCHFTNPEDQFADEGIELKVKGYQIYGHTHTHAKYDTKIVLGVPIVTRNGEKNNPVMKIKESGRVEWITYPVFFDILTIKYGEEMSNKDYLYNIIEAPSYKSVYDCYPTINIRDEGIKLVYAIKEESEVVLKTGGNDLQKMYKLFCNEKEIEDAFLSEGISAISNCTVN